MPELTQRHIQMIEETHDTANTLKTIMLGANGNEKSGLVFKLDEVCKNHSRLERNFWILVAFLVGSGVLAGTIFGVLSGG